jgi:hypothetical protein
MTFGIHEWHINNVIGRVIEVDLTFKVCFTKFVSSFQGCRIIECRIEEVGLYLKGIIFLHWSL